MSAYDRVKLSENIWMTLRRVHADVKAAFIWVSDEKNFGERERWDRPVRSPSGHLRGDCDDFTIECDYRLREVGINPKAMCYYICKTERDGNHMVLGVHADAGTFMLDNRQDGPMDAVELDDRGYHEWARPQPGHPITDPWQTIEFGQGAA